MNLTGKTATITGAASGFGRAFALACADADMNLVLADLDIEGLTETCRQAEAHGAQVITARCDVANAAEVESLAEAAAAAFGPVHLLFNNAGVAAAGPAWLSTPEDWQWVLGVNLMGVVHGVQSFVPAMIAHGQPAHVVNIASIAGLVAPPGLAVYAASKHAVVAFSECLHHDLAAAGARIGVSVVCPGFVQTGIAQSHRNRPAALARSNPEAARHVGGVITAMQASPLDAGDVARLTLDAVRAGRFYVLTHPGTDRAVGQRLNDLAAQATPRAPAIA